MCTTTTVALPTKREHPHCGRERETLLCFGKAGRKVPSSWSLPATTITIALEGPHPGFTAQPGWELSLPTLSARNQQNKLKLKTN
jgi:hypothetical protein